MLLHLFVDSEYLQDLVKDSPLCTIQSMYSLRGGGSMYITQFKPGCGIYPSIYPGGIIYIHIKPGWGIYIYIFRWDYLHSPDYHNYLKWREGENHKFSAHPQLLITT